MSWGLARSPGHLGAGMSDSGRRVGDGTTDGMREPISGNLGSRRPIGKTWPPHLRKITGHPMFQG